uniref:Ephrin type-A receptor 3 n=1 Tax=Aceria tosichella TaxID=561515 RepID=A0A6G1SDN7_9ACAR
MPIDLLKRSTSQISIKCKSPQTTSRPNNSRRQLSKRHTRSRHKSGAVNANKWPERGDHDETQIETTNSPLSSSSCRLTTTTATTTNSTTTTTSNNTKTSSADRSWRPKMARGNQLTTDWSKISISLLAIILMASGQLKSGQAYHQQQQQQPHQASDSPHEAGQRGRSSSMAVLLDTTEQSSLGWTRYPDGGPGAQGRTPGWSEESFLQMERDINWRSFVTCDVAYNSVNNWLWTPYIERGDANRLYIEIKFTMRDCNLFPQMVLSCKETFALLYHEVDGPIQAPASQSAANVSFAQADNYKLIDAIAADEGRFTSNSDVVINTEIRSVPVSKRGLYFAFRDQGACLSLIAIKVYSLKCPALTTSLARFNATPTGRDLTSLVAVEGECVPNSVQIEQPRMFCSADGQWNAMSSGQCKCLAGFEPVQNQTKCQACPPGRYKATIGDSPCLPCPERSHSQQPGASECKCHEGHFRAPKDPRSAACSQPPGGPAQNLTASYVDSTSVVLQWQPPRHTGYRDDLTYKLLCDSCDFATLISSPQFFTNFSETKCVLSGLQPGTSYRFVLYTANGVSLQAAISGHNYMQQQQQQFSEITIQTSKPTAQTTSNTLSTQNGLQLLPIYNFRAFPGSRGSDMLLAWDTQSSSSSSDASGNSQQSGNSDLLLDSVVPLSSSDAPQPSLYEIKFQPRSLTHSSQEQLMLARRSPYPLLFDQQQQQQPGAAQTMAQSVTTTNKAAAIYTLQPRTEYAFQIRAKFGHSSQWTDWSAPIFATTGSSSTSHQQQQYQHQPMPMPPQGQDPLPFPFEPMPVWPPLSPMPFPSPGSGQPPTTGSTWTLGSVAIVLLSSLVVSILLTIALVHYRNSMCLKSLSSSLSGGLMGSNVGSTYAGVYNGGTSSDLIAGVANGGPLAGSGGGNYGSGGAGGALIYHNAPAGLHHHHHHLHTTLSAGSAGALITGSNSTSRSSSGTGNVVQNFLAATLGQLAGHHHHNSNNNNQAHNHTSHITTKTLDAHSHQQGKLFSNNNAGGTHGGHLGANGDHSPNGLLDLHQHQQQRNHYHQMLGNVNHTLLFSGNQSAALAPGQYQQQQPIPIVPPSGGPHHHNLSQHLSNLQQQQQQLANGNSPQPPQVADLFNGHHHQQSKYGNSRTLSGQQQQHQQYGLANLHDQQQVHIYDDLEVVSQSRQSVDCSPEMLKFGQQQQHQTLSNLVQQHQSQLNKQAAAVGRHHQTEIYASTRELYEPTTKLVIGTNGQEHQQQQQNLNKSHSQQQQQQLARAKFYKDRAEDEFYDE